MGFMAVTERADNRHASSRRFADDAARWAAVVERDPGADGAFYYSVKTTGVYCRPSCAARLARRENVQFHESPAEAERAGFRPCKRCRPDQPSLTERRAAAVAEACRLIEAAEELPDLATLAATAGMSRHHFHRVFKGVTGVTPRAYAAAHRAHKVRRGLASGDSVTATMYDAGFNSSGRFYAQSDGILGMTPSAFKRGGPGAAIRFAVGQCSLGAVLVAATDKGICAITLGRRSCRPAARSAGPIPQGRADRRRRKVRAARGPGGRSGRKSRREPRPAARHPGHRVPTPRVAGPARRFPRARPRPTARSPGASARQPRRGRWRGPAPPMPSPWRSRAIVWCGPTGRSRAIAGASSASASCSNARRPNESAAGHRGSGTSRAARSTGTAWPPSSMPRAAPC